MAIYKVSHRVVVDANQRLSVSSLGGYQYKVIAEATRYQNQTAFGTPVRCAESTFNGASNPNLMLIPDEIASNKEMLESHLLLVTGEPWTVFDNTIEGNIK